MISGWYMASTTNINPKYNSTMGVMHSLAQGKSNNWNRDRLDAGVPWCLDNGMFADKFDEDVWRNRMLGLVPYQDTCLFVTVPDIIGNCDETINRFHRYRNEVKDFPVALVSQDGIMKHKDIPWNDFDCLFIGGSDEHKLGKEGGWILAEAKSRNKWVHVGRVNSPTRLLKFWQADSWDGTHLGFNPSEISKLHAAVLQARAMKTQKGLFE